MTSSAWRITAAKARSIWDSRGNPTIEVELDTAVARGRGIAPSGASTGRFEARELRDADGSGVADACTGFHNHIAPALIGLDLREQAAIDRLLRDIDGTPDASRLGGNTTIATSFAVLNTAAAAAGEPLWRWLAHTSDLAMPMPEIQMIGGGAHAARRIDVQDIMVVPVGAPDWTTALNWCARLYRAVGETMRDRGRYAGVADEGGFWPNLDRNEDAFELVTLAMERAGFAPMDDMAISIDVAATQLRSSGVRGEMYHLGADGQELSRADFIDRLLQWTARYPIVMVEDPAAEDDVSGYQAFFAGFSTSGLVVGDDLVVTNAARIAAAAADRAVSAALIKPNQAGTVTEASAAVDACLHAGVVPVVSARSGETEDTTLVHLAIGWRAPFVKVGSIVRGERTAKWNEGIRIAESLTDGGRLPARELLRL